MENYLKLAQEIAEGSAEIALKYFGFETETTWKSDNSPITQADTEINSFVIKKIQEKYPEHGIQGEEESYTKEGSKYVWLCDPIDGTTPYSVGLPTFSFSLALVDQETGFPVLGLINDPVHKYMYWAYKGGGAFRNGNKIKVNTVTELKNSYIEVDGSGKKIGWSKSKVIEDLIREGAQVMSLLSIVYPAVQVANGKFSGAVFLGVEAHDVAALKIIIEEAGGKVTDVEGKERRYDKKGVGCVMSNGILHVKILELLKHGRVIIN